MHPVTIAIVATVGLCVIGVMGDYVLKQASNRPVPLSSWWFVLDFLVYSSTAFGLVYVMRHLRVAALGAVYAVFSVLC